MKSCNKCKTCYAEPLENHFNKRKDTKDGWQRNCKKCIAIFHKEHYQKRKDYYLEKSERHNAQYRKRNLQYMIDYLKLHPCVDCGESDPIVLEFDHRGNKEYNVSKLSTNSFEKLQKEIAKCDVRCANCHRRKTAKQFGYYKDIQL